MNPFADYQTDLEDLLRILAAVLEVDRDEGHWFIETTLFNPDACKYCLINTQTGRSRHLGKGESNESVQAKARRIVAED